MKYGEKERRRIRGGWPWRTVRQGCPARAFNPERNREPIVPIGGWLDRLCPLIMRGGDARCQCGLNSAARCWRYSCQPRYLTDPFARSQSLLGFLDFGGRDWRAAKPNRCCTCRSLTTENSLATGLAEVERHHFRKVEDGQTVAVAVSRFCSCKYNATLGDRHISMKPTSSASVRPTRSIP